LLAETGLFNAAGDLGITFGGFASLEAIVNLKPDLIVVSEAGDRAEDDGAPSCCTPRWSASIRHQDASSFRSG
jgi:hypothetical protein